MAGKRRKAAAAAGRGGALAPTKKDAPLKNGDAAIRAPSSKPIPRPPRHPSSSSIRELNRSALIIKLTVVGFLALVFLATVVDWGSLHVQVESVVDTLWQLCMNAPTPSRDFVDWMLSHVTEYRMSIVQNCATFLAIVWISWRSWLTLRKPVQELINILGVEVPDSPRVSLAGIKADAVTLHWTRPEVNKPVTKYLIQVNGVNVGESSKQDTAITVTGLKPGHFYNIRVIAVGSNNFQAGSNVIRLRTYGRDGRPILGNGRVPSNLTMEDQPNGTVGESSDEAPAVRSHGAAVEAATVSEGPPNMVREVSGQGQRRNTGGRRHSPSTAAADQAAVANLIRSSHSEETMQQLAERFESIRKETEDVMTQIAKDADDYKTQLQDLYKERDERKQQLKEKEAASLSLKTEATHTERQNRQAQNRKTQKEKMLRDKQAERVKMLDDMSRWRKEIENMKNERESWKKEREELLKAKEIEAGEIRRTLRKRQDSLSGLEEEIRIKGLQIKDLEEERQNLPGAKDDDESRQSDAMDRQYAQEWEQKEREMSIRLNQQQSYLRELQMKYRNAQQYLSSLQAQQSSGSLMYHGNSSAVDFDPMGQGKAKSRRSRNRKSRTNTISSPISGYPITDSSFPSASAYNNINSTTSPSFAPGPYIDMSNDTTGMVPLSDHMSGMSEAEIRALTAGAPLSPTATSLLPSNIFENDDEPPGPRADSPGSFGAALYGGALPPTYELKDARQSPDSSNHSSSLISSPRASSQNLGVFSTAGRDFGSENERRSVHSPRTEYGAIGTPAGSDQNASHKGFSSIFTFPRRGKTMQEDGPPLGSLKTTQSQSLPREDTADVLAKHRRISFSSTWGLPSLLKGNSAGDATEGNAPAPARSAGTRRRRGFNIFGSSIDDPNTMYSERDPSSPRPVSIASSDLPRPSTDSAPFGWPAAEGMVINRNSPLATNWSINAPSTWSRNPSRRPSLHQHGSSSHLPTGLATEEDEFLPPDPFTGQSSPPPVGVIGTRPPSAHKPVTPKLNPAAPTFKATFPMFGRAVKSEKTKTKENKIDTPSPEDNPVPSIAISPSDSRKSRDTPSIRTQHSIADSRDSENPSLERISSSNGHSDTTTPSVVSTKDKEPSSLQKLLRKGSSSKFSFSSIRKDFSGKKGPSSSANSDRNDREGSFDEGGEDDMAHSVGSYTSSPNIGSQPSSESRDSGRRSVNWGRPFSGFKQKGKESMRQSIDTDGTPSEATDRDEERSEGGL